jgi:serine/threonine-protein kinase HipA
MAGNAPRPWKTDADGRLEEMSVFANVDAAPVLVGAMSFRGRRGGLRQGTFRFEQSWLDRGARPLFAHGLRAKKVVVSVPPHEVPLPFYDASPDGWGKALLGMAYPDLQMGAPEFIAASGNERVGNLQFGPDASGPETWVPAPPMLDLPRDHDSLADLMNAADAYESGVATRSHLALLLNSGADIGGARPKARILVDGEPWIVKLRASDDRFDTQRAEAACLSVAAQAGIETPEHRVEVVEGHSALLVKRFDRRGTTRFPYTSAATVLEYPPSMYRPENASYADMALKAQRVGIVPCERELFGRMLLNCFLNNTDDHLHNTGFIDDRSGWRLSPIFDVVCQVPRALVLRPARGMSAEANPHTALLAHEKFGIDRDEAQAIFERVRDAAASFPDWLRHYGVNDRDMGVLAQLATHAMDAAKSVVRHPTGGIGHPQVPDYPADTHEHVVRGDTVLVYRKSVDGRHPVLDNPHGPAVVGPDKTSWALNGETMSEDEWRRHPDVVAQLGSPPEP